VEKLKFGRTYLTPLRPCNSAMAASSSMRVGVGDGSGVDDAAPSDLSPFDSPAPSSFADPSWL
jgi:hypothetical protein